jgi:aspartate 1-decarboxylase
MLRLMHKSKLHGLTIRQAELHYTGSITLDEDLMEAAALVENEMVMIANMNNGARFETYVIKGERGSGMVALNGAAARLGLVGDKIIVISTAYFSEAEVASHRPKVVKVDEKNRPLR